MRLSAIGGRSTALACLLAGTLSAQNMGPPPYLQIVREEVKAGHTGSLHVLTEAGWPRAFAKAKIANNYIALTTIYGPNEAWFVEGHASVAEIEAVNQTIAAAPGLSQELDRLSLADAAHIANARTLLARFSPQTSNPGEINPAEARAWEVTVFRVRPGKEGSFFEGAKLYQSLVQQAKANATWASYEVMAGMPGPTYLVFSPHKTLAEIDGVGAAMEKVMNEETMKKFGTLSEGFISVENFMFVPSPEMSYVPAEWMKQDPKYWGKKAMSPTAPKPTP